MLDYLDIQMVNGGGTITAIPGYLVIANATNGNIIINLPPSDGGTICVGVLRTDASGNSVTLVAAGKPPAYVAPHSAPVANTTPPDKIAGTATVTIQNEIRTYVALKGTWYYS